MEKTWKLTAETRARMSAAQRKRFAAKKSGRVVIAARRKKEPANARDTAQEIDAGTFGYALGYIESWLGTYAAAASVPASTLAARVGKVLQSKARG
jgi:hypothetical protein